MELAHTQDHILLHRWHQRRDAEAFRALVERHAGLVYAAAHRVLRDATDAEDVSQECFITLARSRSLPERHLGAWLYTVAVNRAKDHIRGAARRRKREALHGTAQPEAVEAIWDDTLAHVDEAIAALDDELRFVVIAHFLEAKSQGEIADTMGVSRQTVNARVKRGIEAIREHLAKKGITATTASLTTLLGTQMVEAAPATLVAALGKLALSGGAVAAGGGVVASLVGLLTTKVAAGLAAIVVAVLSFFTYQELVSRSPTSTEREALNRSVDVSEADPAPEPDSPIAETVQATAEVLSASANIADGGGVLAGTILDENGDLMKRHVTIYANAQHPKDLKMDWQSPEGQRCARDHIGRQVESHDGVFELQPYTKPNTIGVIFAVDEEGRRSEPLSFDLSRGDHR